MKKLLLVCLFGAMILSGCDVLQRSKDLSLTGYSKSAVRGASVQSASASVITFASEHDETYNPNAYRAFPIDNQGKNIRDREVTVGAILQFEREVPGYDDDPSGYVGYLANHSSYPSNASRTKAEGVYLVFDSRKPAERYQVGYHHTNLDISNSNLTYFENLIKYGQPISIFHVDTDGGVTCWVVQWIPESSGGIVGTPF